MASGALGPLPDGLLDAVRGFLRDEGLPTADAELARGVREVSDAYNAAAFPVRWTPAREAARLVFFLPRDARKVEAALRDVPLALQPDGEVRVLDVGAGVGASALGAVLALRRRGVTGTIHLQLVEPEARALGLGERLLTRLGALDGVGPLVISARTGDVRAGTDEHDLVIAAQVLVEVGVVAKPRPGAEEARAVQHAAIVRGWLRERLVPSGRIVLVEPALKASARRLQGVRAALLASRHAGAMPVHVVAPCPHDGACPLLAREDDWCHEDLDVDLPPALANIARMAGLRWQGLTYARLVLAREPVARPALRVAAPPHPTRGKRALPLCVPGREQLVTVERLDRHESEQNAAWGELQRGDGLSVEGVDLEGPLPRVGTEAVVTAWGARLEHDNLA